MSYATASDEGKEGLSTQFKVVIPELRDMVFKSCEGLESEIEVPIRFQLRD